MGRLPPVVRGVIGRTVLRLDGTAVRLVHPGTAALVGGLFAVPFLTANAIVAKRIEPFFSFIRPGLHTSAIEYALLVFVIGCLPVGAFISARPLWNRDAGGARHLHALNAVVAATLLVGFAVLTAALGSEIYRCDVLQIPNCD
jgi:hypothetical protein